MAIENPLVSILNKQVANWSVMYMKLHNYHWYVKGEHFFTLHIKFEELYNEAALHLDDLAERVLALQGKPVATMKECLSIGSITEASGDETAQLMVEQLSKDFAVIIKELEDGMLLAGKHSDETTADMLLAIHSSLEKHQWMLRAFLA